MGCWLCGLACFERGDVVGVERECDGSPCCGCDAHVRSEPSRFAVDVVVANRLCEMVEDRLGGIWRGCAGEGGAVALCCRIRAEGEIWDEQDSCGGIGRGGLEL